MNAASFGADVSRLDELSATELYALLKLRTDVFIVEQKCPYPELDGRDPDALHLRLMQDGELLAAARFFAPGDQSEHAKIGRVVVAPAHRGKRLGDALMRETIAACEDRFPGHALALSAQSHLKAFYASFGFAVCSDEYLNDGIPHIDMLRPTRVAVN